MRVGERCTWGFAGEWALMTTRSDEVGGFGQSLGANHRQIGLNRYGEEGAVAQSESFIDSFYWRNRVKMQHISR